MAFTHIAFNAQTVYGSMLRAFLRTCESADDQFVDVRSMMLQMRDGDGTSNAHYAELVRRFGFGDYDSTQGTPTDAQNAKARAAFEEIDSAFSKTSGNGSVTDVRAARDQMFDKLGAKMADLWYDVDTALSEVPINLLSLIDDTDFKTREESVAYNAGGLDLVWNFVTTAGAMTQTAVTPTDTGGNYDWVNQGNGMYSIEIPASGGASINNDTEGFGWFTGFATGILPWRSPVLGFRHAALNNSLIDAGTTGLLAPGTAARTLTVTASGAASVNWGDVENKTTTNALTNTTIATTQQVDVNTIKTNPVVNAGTVTFPTGATLASTTNITAGTVTTATNVTTVNGLAANVITATSINADAITAAKIADGAIDAATFAANAITATVLAADCITAAKVADGTIDAATFAADAISATAVSAAAVTKIQNGLATPTNITAGTITTVTNLTNAATAGDFTSTMKTSIGTAVAASAVASVTGNVGGNVNGNVVGSVGSVVGAVGSVTGAVGSVTGNVGGNVNGSVASVVGNVGGSVASVVGNVGGSVASVVGNVGGTVASVVGNVGGNVTGTVASVVGDVGGNVDGNVAGSVGSVTGNVGGNLAGTIGGLTTAALADFFTSDSGETYADAVAGSVVKEIADNAGGSSLTVQQIVDGVLNEPTADHTDPGSVGLAIGSTLTTVVAIENQTDDIGVAGAGLTDIPWNPDWDAEVQSEVLDAIRTQLTGSAAAPGVLPTLDQIAYMIGQFVQDVGVVGTTKTIYGVDGVTPLFTLTLSDATNPTATQRAT